MQTENKTIHSQGPWEQSDGDPTWIKSASGEYIADVLSGPDCPSYETACDNARLIAAAPELLAALERMEKGVRLWMTVGVTDDDMKAAQDAIRKAKGEA